MKTFQELLINIDKEKISYFIENLEKKITSEWARDKVREEELKKFSMTDSNRFCFEFKGTENIPSARLILVEKDNGGLFISNIVPLSKNKLSYDEYNEILIKFFEIVLFVLKTTDMENTKAEITKSNIELDDLISDESKNLFISFSNNANKSTGNSHPQDKKRWFDFILSIYIKKEKLEPEELEKFLIEDEWSEDSAINLAIDFEYSLALLAYYDENNIK
jgi:hypothetical protein